MPADFVSYNRALALVAELTAPLPPLEFPLPRLGGLVLAEELISRVSSPSVTCSKKDGFALRAADVSGAGPEAPVRLAVAGSVTAGQRPDFSLGPGQAARVTTGAALPPGADAVLPDELARREEEAVFCLAPVEPGRNLLAQGSDVVAGEPVAGPGERLTPGLVGLMAAAGLDRARCHPLPRVALMATGNELSAPGEPLPEGGVYASNLASQAVWLQAHGLPVQTRVCPDSRRAIRETAAGLLAENDALITSGGAWLSERDLVVGTLAELGLGLCFRRVRMGPGKGVAFGLIGSKPVFCLPGSPPSNEMAFLQLALPALLLLAGHRRPGLPLLRARMGQELRGQGDWTQFWHGTLEPSEDIYIFKPLDWVGRLQVTARAQALFTLNEGVERVPAGALTWVQRLEVAFDRESIRAQPAERHSGA